MNIGIPGRAGIDYKNHYDKKTETISWCAKKNTHSKQPLMQQIINGDLNLFFFARWQRDETNWTFLGEGEVISYQDNVPVADKDGKDTICMEYQLTCKSLSGNIKVNEIKSKELILKDTKPKQVLRKKLKRSFKGRKSRNYVLKAKRDKKIGDLGEELVLRYEKAKLKKIGIKNSLQVLEHTSKIKGDGTGYDIKSVDENGKTIFIEVKTTEQDIDTEFFMTRNEIEFSRSNKDCYFLYRVYNLNEQPFLYILSGYILDKFHAEPIEFRMIKK